MRYQVPQFIDVEDKIFGPLTFKQFAYLVGGGGLCLLFFTTLPTYIAIILSLPVAGLAAALAFYHVNGRPFVFAVENAMSYFFGHKLYLWKQRTPKQAEQPQAAQTSAAANLVPKLSESRLKDLAWSLNIKDRNTMGVTDTKPTGFEL